MNELDLPRVFASREVEVLNYFSSEENCDLTFIVGEEEAALHTSQSAVSAVSPVFKAMLSSEMKEGKKKKKRKVVHFPNVTDERKVVHIPDVKYEALNCVVRYAHGIQFKVNIDNCVDVRRVAEKYQIISLIPFLDDFIVSVLNEENFCNVWGEVCIFHFSDLKQKCLEKLAALDNKAMILSDGFANLSFDQFKLLLDSDELKVDEETLWERCLIWAANLSAFDEEREKRDILKQVKNSIRFPVMKPDFIVENVYPENVLEQSEYTMVLSFAVTPTFSDITTFSTWPRKIAKIFVHGAGLDFVNGEYIVGHNNIFSGRYFVKHNTQVGAGMHVSMTLSRNWSDMQKWEFSFCTTNGGNSTHHLYHSYEQNEHTKDSKFPPRFGWEIQRRRWEGIKLVLRRYGYQRLICNQSPTLMFR